MHAVPRFPLKDEQSFERFKEDGNDLPQVRNPRKQAQRQV